MSVVPRSGSKMRLVSENSDAELARRRALERVEAALHELGANMLRVVRGAGKPYELGAQAVEFSQAMQAYFDIAKMYPSSGELAEMLSIEEDHAGLREVLKLPATPEHAAIRADAIAMAYDGNGDLIGDPAYLGQVAILQLVRSFTGAI